MKVVYPYNEILPTRKAHDVFLFKECASLADLGAEVFLLCGKGSADKSELCEHYHVSRNANLKVLTLPILRKNFGLPFSWNMPFFYFARRKIGQLNPDVVITSVLKQAAHLFENKLPNTRYVYEVHEICHYPTKPADPELIAYEKSVLEKADLITVTTQRLKELLQNSPYSLKVPIIVVPLGVGVKALPPPSPATPLTISYVGQLYKGQGLPLLLQALEGAPDIHLNVLGGKPKEIEALRKQTAQLGIEKRVAFLGFHSPALLPSLLAGSHAFVAPFEATGRMPYVAHTKLFEYAEMGRPIIAPNLPVVTEHFPDKKGLLLFEAGSVSSLASALNALQNQRLRDQLQAEIESLSGAFTFEKRAEHYLRLFA